MLPSPPLTAASGFSSPRSLKRTFSDLVDDDTPPPSQPLKQRRISASAPLRQVQDELWGHLNARFDPSSLITPPEYCHVPYDPEFGVKVCQHYKKSLKTKRACDAVVHASRRHKYGEEDALAYSPGSTPDHIRSSYEIKQRQLDRMAEDIMANSDSDSEIEPDIGVPQSWSARKRKVIKGPQLHMRDRHRQDTFDMARDHGPASSKFDNLSRIPTTTLRNHDTNDKTSYDGAGLVSSSITARCTVLKFGSFGSQRRHRLRQDSRVHILAG